MENELEENCYYVCEDLQLENVTKPGLTEIVCLINIGNLYKIGVVNNHNDIDFVIWTYKSDFKPKIVQKLDYIYEDN